MWKLNVYFIICSMQTMKNNKFKLEDSLKKAIAQQIEIKWM